MPVLIVCVNYNSYKELNSYLDSIEIAAKNEENSNVEVIVADNSPTAEYVDISKWHYISVSVRECSNLGYMGTAQEVINKITNKDKYDYIIISNVDLTVSIDFFRSLSKVNIDVDCGWIAPKILSSVEERDKNPKIVSRPSAKRVKLLKLMYKLPLLHLIYTHTLYKRKKLRPSYEKMDIYAGHGAFFVLTKEFFRRVKTLAYPIFLFGEEQYVGELCRAYKLTVTYNPTLVIYDDEHVSTSLMRKSSYYKYNYQAQSYILKTYYE